MNDQLSFIPLGGIGDVTKNMYLYQYRDEILIVDCGLGFPDETMLGIDLLLPDISYLLKNNKKIVGMLLTHGHEDHMGALPFILPQLPNFPIFATPLTAAFANEKLKEFNIKNRVHLVNFTDTEKTLGNFKFNFIRVTHSVPDTSHIFIKTPVGNFYHGSDFKFDPTPYDGKKTDFAKIEELAKQGVTCLLSDCLGAERQGRTGSELPLLANFEKEIRACRGKFMVTTYSSNISRINQVIEASQRNGRKICFVGRSLVKAKEVAKSLGYLKLNPSNEIEPQQIKNYKDQNLTLIVAGSQGQENSAMTRVANGEHRDIKLKSFDTIVFSSDTIPGNEVSVNEMIDTIAKRDVRVLYSDLISDFHVSGHGSSEELADLIKLVKPKKMIPIGGGYRHMYAYKNIAMKLGYRKEDVFLGDDGQEIIFNKNGARFGNILPSKIVYVDEISGEEMDSFVLRDRQKLSEGGVVIVLAEIDSNTGQLIVDPDIITKGLTFPSDKRLDSQLTNDLKRALASKKGRVTNWSYLRKLVGEISEKRIYKQFHRQPLVLPVVIEV